MQNYFLALLDWLRIKILLRGKLLSPLFKEGEIWWCSMGLNIGTEIFGKGSQFARPVLIFKKFNKDSFLGIPLTSKLKEGKWYVPVLLGETVRTGILSQIRVFDGRRLICKTGTLNDNHFLDIKKALLTFLGS